MANQYNILDTPQSGGGLFVATLRLTKVISQTITTQIPFDDTIPQITEGDEVFSQVWTPASAANIIQVVTGITYRTPAANGTPTVALFQDSMANALAATNGTANVAGVTMVQDLYMNHEFVAGTVSPITLSLRIGYSVAGTGYVNGNGTIAFYGGVINTFFAIYERAPSI